MKVLYISAEMVPYAKEGGLADVAGALPQALKESGIDTRCVLPLYNKIDRKKYSLTKVKNVKPVSVSYNGKNLEATLFESVIPGTDVPVYFVENEFFFGRDGVYNDPKTKEGYSDNAERFVFFNRAVMELLKQLDWKPDIIHLNDHHTSLIAAYLKRSYKEDPYYKDVKTALSIHNLGYQGIYPKEILWFAMFDQAEYYPTSPFEFYDQVNFMKIGIIFSDVINTVSETYAEEIISSEEFGFGLEGVLRDRKNDLYGIVNGIDYNIWSPEVDDLIPFKYSADNLSGKKKNKSALIKEQNLPPADETVPLIGIISRLADQKGFDILAECLDEILKEEIRMIILGSGQKEYHDLFTRYAKKYPKKLAVNLTFNNGLAHKIEAASDMFLMPSRYEPCGLNQLYSMKYGTIPVVRSTGGLKDTVTPFDSKKGTGTGFRFDDYSSDELAGTIAEAVKVYRDKKNWDKLVSNAMNADFSWKQSADKYIAMYKKALKK